jgi:hypothetical protein
LTEKTGKHAWQSTGGNKAAILQDSRAKLRRQLRDATASGTQAAGKPQGERPRRQHGSLCKAMEMWKNALNKSICRF